MRKILGWGTALTTLVSWATTVSAQTITIYTDRAEWESAMSGQFLMETFADDQLNPGVSFVSSESGHINPAQECYQDVLASASHNEPMTTWSFVPEIYGFGGNWTLGGPGGSGNSLLVYIAEIPLYVGTIPNSYNGGFWGFTSDTPFTSVKLVGGGGTNQQNYCFDDMVYSSQESTGDMDGDGDVDLDDYDIFIECLAGPDVTTTPEFCTEMQFDSLDFDADGDVDLTDYAFFQSQFTGPNE